jgi:hypothetical protein
MLNIIQDKSFIATVQCHAPSDGYWDCAHLEGSYHETRRVASDALIVTNYSASPLHRYRFDCYENAEGYCGYTIESFSQAPEIAGIRFGFNSNGLVQLYPVTGAPERFWFPLIKVDEAERSILDDLHVGAVEDVIIRSPDGWTLKRGLAFGDSDDYWMAHVNDAEGRTLQMTLHIERLGLDDD